MILNNRKNIIIFGASGHAVSTASVAIDAGFTVIAFVEDNPKQQYLTGIDVIDVNDLNPQWSNGRIAIAIGHNFSRERIVNYLESRFGALNFPTLIHPSAIVGRSAKIGIGTIVMPGAIIGSNVTIQSFCIINTHASIDHDSCMADYASLAPGVCTGGSVQIGCRTALSIRSTIIHHVRIGHDVVIGGVSYVNKDIPPLCVAYGIPAQVIRTRNIDTPYL